MRILLVTPHYAPELNAPAVRSAAMVAHWVRQGCSVTVLTGRPQQVHRDIDKKYGAQFVTRERDGGVDVIRTWHHPSLQANIFHRGLNYLSFGASALLLGARRLPKFDVVIGSSPQILAGAIAQIIAQRQRVPFIFEVRDLWSEAIGSLGGIGRGTVARSVAMLEQLLYRQASRVVVVTEGARDHLVSQGVPAHRVQYVPHGVDLGLFTEVQREEDARREHYVCGYLGKHGLAQGLSTLLQCAGLLTPETDLRFLLVGDGPEKPLLQRIATEQSLSNVGFMGSRPRDQVPALWNSLDACVVPLRRDPALRFAVPSKLFEAMATETPVVSCASPEANALVEKVGAGIAVEPEDARSLANALTWLRDHPAEARAMGARGRAYVLMERSAERVGTMFMDVLEGAVRGARA